MRKYKRIEVTKHKRFLDSVTCNKCGKTVKVTDPHWEMEEQVYDFGVSFGYGSKYDTENWSWDLCESCLEELVYSFKIKPDGFGENGATYGDEDEVNQIWETRKARYREKKQKTICPACNSEKIGYDPYCPDVGECAECDHVFKIELPEQE